MFYVIFVYMDTDKSKILFGICRYLELVLVSSSDEIASDVRIFHHPVRDNICFSANYVAHAACAGK